MAVGAASFLGIFGCQYVLEHLVLDEVPKDKRYGIELEDVSSMFVQHFRLIPVASEHMKSDGVKVFLFSRSFKDNEFPFFVRVDAIPTDRA